MRFEHQVPAQAKQTCKLMLELFARHSLIDLQVACTGDLHVDAHHSTEDIGICLGQALDRALGDKAGFAGTGTSSCRWTRPW